MNFYHVSDRYWEKLDWQYEKRRKTMNSEQEVVKRVSTLVKTRTKIEKIIPAVNEAFITQQRNLTNHYQTL